MGKTRKDVLICNKTALENNVTLAHHDNSTRLCVYTDTSDIIWSGTITQTPPEDLSKDHIDQRHQPLASLSGHFSGVQLGWSTFEQEVFAIVATEEWTHSLLATSNGFDLFTDHLNLVFLSDFLAVVSDLSQTSLQISFLATFVLVLMIRSASIFKALKTTGLMNYAVGPIRLLFLVWFVLQFLPHHFYLNSPGLHRTKFHPHSSGTPKVVPLFGLSWWFMRKFRPFCLDFWCLWQLTPQIEHHCRYRSFWLQWRQSNRIHPLSEVFLVNHFARHLDLRVLFCSFSVENWGERGPRPSGPIVHGTAPNNLAQFDIVEIAQERTGENYVFWLRNDNFDQKRFYAFTDIAADSAAQVIIDWCAAIGVPKMLMFNGPTHFKNGLYVWPARI